MTARFPCVLQRTGGLVEYIPIPPRSREVRTNELGDEITMRIVAQLKETAPTQKLKGLISGDQLAVSTDGLYAAHVVNPHHGVEIVVHSEIEVMRPRFERPRPRLGTRILQVTSDSLLVWGKVDGHPSGLWRLGRDRSTFLAPIDLLKRLPTGILRGTLESRPDAPLVITPSGGLWPVGGRSLVTSFKNGLSVVEELGGVLHAYEVLEYGRITPFQMLTLSDAQRPIGVIHWQDRLLLAVARGSQSWLVEINRKCPGEKPARIQIDGDLHGLWASPCGKTLAMFIHPRGEPEDVHRLQLSDGRIIHEGRFVLDPSTLSWSPDEQSLAVKITQTEMPDGINTERIIGSRINHPIGLGLHVREVLVNDLGRLAAFIQYDGHYDQPFIGGLAGTQVPLAWNLHHTPEGGIAWSTVHADRILTWTQQRR